MFRKNVLLQNNKYSRSLLSNSTVGNCDIVSFSAKNYDSNSVVNPTNHCAYCGCRVYNQAQLNSIAKELLSSKFSRSEEKINSIIDKLSDAKHSQELSIAKKWENKNQVDFFNKYLDYSSKRPFLKGEEIFEQVYNLDSDSAFELLMANLHPLLKTVDHVSPQREDKENLNSDVNLVEACYTCNHDIKKGLSFNEFYTMFPSIKHNMPKDKFQYATSDTLNSSQTQILRSLSAVNMLKFLEVLFAQRAEISSNLESVDYRIKGCKSNISSAIDSCKSEIAQKQSEKQQLEAKFEQLKKDPEYIAILERADLSAELASVETSLQTLRTRRSRINNNINSLQGQTKKVRKKIEQMSDSDKQKRISALRNEEAALDLQISGLENRQIAIELNIEEHDSKFPTIDMLQTQKAKAENVYNAHITVNKELKLIDEKKIRKSELESQEKELSRQLEEMPENASAFNLESYSQQEQLLFKKYKDLIDAKSYIDEHPNGGTVRVLIHSKAKEPILKEIQEMEQLPVIVDYLNFERKKYLSTELEQVKKKKEEIISSVNQSEKTVRNLKCTVERMSMEDAQKEIALLSDHIRRLNEKQNNIKIRSMISSLSSEILILEQTISNLQTRSDKIESMYSQT